MDIDRLNSLWVEKYRPHKLQDLLLKEDLVDLIKSWGDNIPHILLTGNSGTGKTTLARILIEDILKCDYIYINASDENGVDVIRNKITGFVQTKSLDGNLKVVVLDEADFLSFSAQSVLRNLMETYSNNSRFILTGNFKHKISNALQSRCQDLEPSATVKDVVLRCKHILECENIEVDPEEFKRFYEIVVVNHFPDIRKIIGYLQRFSASGSLVVKELDNQDLLIDEIIEHIQDKKVIGLREILLKKEDIVDWDLLLTNMYRYIIESTIEVDKKRAMVLTIANHLDISSRIVDKEINFIACCLNLENDYASN